ncbi:50S ribosomal protein L3 N(5)-glutamine methyltransferase [Chthonobacter rhizosphaerae]|uniref:50S ribosomal protein L3 N(5)-glutamine methyltransferase n=1 Tax=Chthonobacter rhizosphaerae TaxID=2735553 RepID=UPI0015EEF87D|nr:50S ribosomal protein L3 N(5)-glutamine methyltransferase [Chthonobacter rhizosphaerae]
MPTSDPADDLLTVRDLVRHAVTRFRESGVVTGHGVTGALDDAVFLVLETLRLPIEDVNPWADCRLTRDERRRLVDLIETRVTTRKPTPYLVGRAYIHGIPFRVDERVLIPRSFIGEILFSDVIGGAGFTLVDEPAAVGRVLDLCTGSGCLAILAARVFENAEVDAVDLSPDALAVARLNVSDHDLEDRVALHQGDLFAPLGDARYDLIITNPPYVEAAVMDSLPPEYRHEPEMALAGGPDGLDIVRRILAAAPDHLLPGGGILCEIGTGREILDEEFPDLPFLWLDTEESEGEVFWLDADAFGIR